MKKNLLLSLGFASFSALSSQDIVLKHVFKDPKIVETFSELVSHYNSLNPEDKVTLVPSQDELKNDGEGAHIYHRYETETGTMVAHPEKFRPVGKLMRKYYPRYQSLKYVDVVLEQLLLSNGELAALPFAPSAGVFFYNKDALRKAGQDPDKFPLTWEECEPVWKALRAAGYKGFTTVYPVAYHIEHMCSIHNEPFATNNNGFDSTSDELRFVFDSQLIKFHFGQLLRYQKEGFFLYSGQDYVATLQKFLDGEVAMLAAGAISYNYLKEKASFEIGVGALPYWFRFSANPYSLDFGGGALWVAPKLKGEQYKSIAKFFMYLSRPDVLGAWHMATLYLPTTKEAYEMALKTGFYKTNEAAFYATTQTMNRAKTPSSRGIRVDNYPAIRTEIAKHVERIFKGEVSYQEGLGEACTAANLMFAQSSKAHQAQK
jgi:sn-glycerol 3-phosphate transport system substrate-binding protein